MAFMNHNTEQNREVAIRLSGIKKQYRLGQIGGGTLQGDLQSWWAKIRGKDDPNLKIGQDQQLGGQSFMALNGIDLTVYKGEALGIIGANGAGKSTMLKLLSRVTAPTEGEIDIYGRISSMLEVGTGFHSQMTGRENIYMNGAILGMSKAEIDQKLDSIITFSEVEEFIDTPVKRYSSGMFVKLAFAVAAHLNSEILIMDEVLAVGDMAFQKKCLEKMREAASEEGRTILYVSHNMNTIRELCDRCIVMDKGKIIFDGDVDEAIAIYMTHSLDENQVDMDLSCKPHTGKTGKGVDTGLFMQQLTLADKTVPVYDTEEMLNLRFKLLISKPVKGVQLRFTLRMDTDQAVGTAWSIPIDFNKTGEIEAEFSFGLQSLAKGNFYASIGFYQMDDAGKMLQLDHITRAFRIEIAPKIGIKNWGSRALGAVHFPDMEGRIV